jgi:hypothetical protein
VANGAPAGWVAKAYHTKTALFAWDDANSYVDSKSLHITLDTPNQAAWQQTVSVEPHRRYQLSGWVKTVDVGRALEEQDKESNHVSEYHGAARRVDGW